MRRAIGTMCLALVATWAEPAQAQDNANSRAANTPRPATTLELLNARVAEVAFDQAPLDEALDWINSIAKLNVVTRWQQLEQLGIERDLPVTLHARNLRLSQVLWIILDQAAGTDVRLAFQAGDGLLVISTAEDLERETVVKVYDVSDLLLRFPRFTSAPQIEVGTNSGGANDQSVFGSGGNASGSAEGVRDATGAEELSGRLIRLITSTVEPDSWRDVGGRGTIQAFGNLLVVRACPRVHQLLDGGE